MLFSLHEGHQDASLVFAIARTPPALSARMACAWGRGAASQSDAGGWPASTQGRTEGTETKKEKREEEKVSEESNEAKDCNKEDKWSKSTSSEETEMEEPTKPPAKTQASTQPGEDDINERKEGKMTIMNPPHVMWKCVVKYARKVIVHVKGPLMNIVWNVWPARRL